MDERRSEGLSLDGVLVKPGEMAVAIDGSTLVTIAGVGVVASFWSRYPAVAGIAHFVEPRAGNPDGATGRSADAALPEIVRLVRERGAKDIEVQLFGGSKTDPDDGRGEHTIKAALRILERLRLPVASTDLGGTKGRKIVFDTSSGQVAVVKVHELRQGDWNP